MPYCVACGTKTGFDHSDCPNCGDPISQRIDLPDEESSDGVDSGSSAASAAGFASATESGPETRESDTSGTTESEASTTPTNAARSEATRAAAHDGTARDEPPTEVTTIVDGPTPFADTSAPVFAVGYPIRGGTTPVIVGSILTAVTLFLPFVALVTWGYGFRLTQAAARGQTVRPAFEDYGQLFVDGLKSAVVVSVYVTLALVGWIIAAVVGTVDQPSGIALSMAIALAGASLLPASLTAYAATGELESAFRRSEAGAFLRSSAYSRAYVVWLVGVVVTSIFTLLSLLTVVGIFPAVTWSGYSLAALWGYYYRAAVANGEVPPAPAEAV